MRQVVGDGLGVVEVRLESKDFVLEFADEGSLVRQLRAPGLEPLLTELPLLLHALSQDAELHKYGRVQVDNCLYIYIYTYLFPERLRAVELCSGERSGL